VHFIKNTMALSWVSLPFIKMYLQYNPLLQKQRKKEVLWRKIENRIPLAGSLDPSLKRRILYYVFANRLTMHWFATLRNKPLTKREKEIGIWLGMATPICDHFVEEHQFTAQQLKEILHGKIDHPYALCGNEVYRIARSLIKNKIPFDHFLDRILVAQGHSLQLQDPAISKATLEKNLREVGGNAMLVYRTGLDNPIKKQEEQAIYQLGSIMQLHNEIFDIYKDIRQGMGSVPLTYQNMPPLQKRYKQDISIMIQSFQELGYPAFAKRKFLMLVLLALSTGVICLKQYAVLEKKDNGQFNPSKYTRQELVCDMDHPLKILQSLYLTLKWKW
jgi:hypothetical protein